MWGENLKTARRKLGLTQWKLAQLLGVPEIKVTRWETNRIQLTNDDVVDIARVLNCDPEEIRVKQFSN